MEVAVAAGVPAAGEGPTGALVTTQEPGAPQPVRSLPRSPRVSDIQRGSLSQRLGLAGPPGTPGTRSSSCAGMPAPINARAGQEGAMLTAVRRQMEQLEEKLNGQITRVTAHSDRLRDAAFSRVDAKMGSMEVLQPKLDRKLAELSGNYKGLSDEMQSQIRRIDQMDSRLWDCRHQLEEEVREKFSEFEHSSMQIDSRVRTEKTATDDILKKYNRRLLRLEALEERVLSLDASNEDTRQNLEHLHGRLLDIEQCRAQDLALCSYSSPSRDVAAPLHQGVDPALFEALESRVSDSIKRMETIQQDFMDVHSRQETQEERCKILRTQMDSREENYQKLKDRVERADWEGRLKDIAAQVKEMDQYKLMFAEQFSKLDLLQKKMDFSEHAVEELQRLQKERALSTPLRAEPAPPEWAQLSVPEPSLNGEAQVLSLEVKDCSTRCRSAEARLDEVCGELQAIRADMELAPRVTALVDQLKEVAPKVIDQEQVVRELHEKVGRMEVRMGLGRGGAADDAAQAEGGAGDADVSNKGALESIGNRVGRLEAETARLKAEIEGVDAATPRG